MVNIETLLEDAIAAVDGLEGPAHMLLSSIAGVVGYQVRIPGALAHVAEDQPAAEKYASEYLAKRLGIADPNWVATPELRHAANIIIAVELEVHL